MARRSHRRPKGRGKRRARRSLGSVIIFALTVLTPILVAGGTVLSSLKSYSDEVERRIHSVTAQLIAASGAHQALATVTRDLSFRGKLELPINGGRFAADVTQIAGANTLDLSDDMVQIRSEGWLNGPADGDTAPRPQGVHWYRSVVTATVRPRLLKFAVDQTLFVADPAAQVQLSGTTFQIAGEDTAANPKPPLPGIGIAGDPTPFVNQISPALQPMITGKAASSIASVHQTAPVDVKAWIDRFKKKATIVWDTTSQQLDTCELGNCSDPAIAFATGSLNIRGDVTGHGVLVVQGDLRVTGGLNFGGIILVGGTVAFKSPTQTPSTTQGALLVGGDGTKKDIDINGNVQIRYDSSVIDQLVGQFVDGVELISWDIDLDASDPGLGGSP